MQFHWPKTFNRSLAPWLRRQDAYCMLYFCKFVKEVLFKTLIEGGGCIFLSEMLCTWVKTHGKSKYNKGL